MSENINGSVSLLARAKLLNLGGRCRLHQLSEIPFALSHIVSKQNITFGFLNVFNDK
jgi:hypothetical protein